METALKEGALFNFCKRKSSFLRHLSIRLPKSVGRLMFKERIFRDYAWHYILSKLYYENIMRYRCKEVGENLQLFHDLPFMQGDGEICIGDNVTMQGHIVMFTGGHVYRDSEIRIGDNSTIGFGVVLRAARSVSIGRNCLIGNFVTISDNDGHPIGLHRDLGVSPKDVKPVIIEDDVWVGEHCIILKGVTIGRGCIVSSGSVVTKSVPPMKIVMGNPARVAMWVPEGEE
jgi:acetyltransferase-like isoleucine patch superfamily enzyme